jgi:hypothetical protein
MITLESTVVFQIRDLPYVTRFSDQNLIKATYFGPNHSALWKRQVQPRHR